MPNFQPKKLFFLIISGLFLNQNTFANEIPETELPEVSVVGNKIKNLFKKYDSPTISSAFKDDQNNYRLNDATSLITKIPNANVIHHGSQTGIVQIRGLSQDRIKVKIDGMEITPACPNHMDPPMHYANMNELNNIQVISGITPVSQGGDSLNGTISVKTKAPEFSTISTAVSFGYSGSNDGTRFAVENNISNQSLALNINYEKNKADNLISPKGEIKNSSYDIAKTNLNLSTKINTNHQLGLELGQQIGKNLGTPALGMDMTKDNAYKTAINYFGQFDNVEIDSKIYHHKIDHIMDNFTMRTAMMSMIAPATSVNTGFILNSKIIAKNNDIFRVGIEQHQNDFDVYMINNMNKMRQDSFNNDSRNRLGIYGEWETKLSEKNRLLAGLRSDTVKTSANKIQNIGMADPMKIAQQTAFNNANLSKTDHNFDWTLLNTYQHNDNLSYEMGIARKTRSPSIVERYIWTPSSTYGQADGRSYLGNPDLNPEVSHQINLGISYKTTTSYLKANVFYNKISDYIQGVATTNLDANNNSILKYDNISSAVLTGFDIAFGHQLNSQFKIDGNFGFTQGKNKSNDDNLYRIAPAKLQVNFSYLPTEKLTHNLEIITASKQSKVSKYNNEMPTAGYGVVNFSTTYKFRKNSHFVFGVDNLGDKTYAEHLNGKNQIANSAVAIGERLLNPARFAYFGMKADF